MIDEPDLRGRLPKSLRPEFWIVKIGVVDEVLARSSPYPESDFRAVIADLANFLRMNGVE